MTSDEYVLSQTYYGLIVLLYFMQKCIAGKFTPPSNFPSDLGGLIHQCRNAAIRKTILSESEDFSNKVSSG